eukprot:9485318-Pyramimonas_sp.AAC.2
MGLAASVSTAAVLPWWAPVSIVLGHVTARSGRRISGCCPTKLGQTAQNGGDEVVEGITVVLGEAEVDGVEAAGVVYDGRSSRSK